MKAARPGAENRTGKWIINNPPPLSFLSQQGFGAMQSTHQLPAAQTIKNSKKKNSLLHISLQRPKLGSHNIRENQEFYFGPETGHTGSSSVLENQTCSQNR